MLESVSLFSQYRTPRGYQQFGNSAHERDSDVEQRADVEEQGQKPNSHAASRILSSTRGAGFALT